MPYRLADEKLRPLRRQDTLTESGASETTSEEEVTSTSTPVVVSTSTSTPPVVSTSVDITTSSTSRSIPTPVSSTSANGGGGGGGGVTPTSVPVVTSIPITSTFPDGSTGVIYSTTAPASVQSVVTRTYLITSNGVIYTSTSLTPTMIANTANNKSSNNIPAIVGGVVGGLAGLGLLLLLAFWLKRRGRKNDLDGEFDPDHAKRPSRMRGSIDLDENPEMTPHPYNFQAASTRPISGGAPVPGQAFSTSTAYGDSPYPAVRPQSGIYSPGPSEGYPISDGGLSGSSARTPYSGHASNSGLAGLGAGAARMHTHTNSQSLTSSGARSAKEREAMARSGGMHLATGSGEEDDYDRGPIVQHADGGRVAPREEGREIPPAYDTIPQDEREASGSGGAGPSSGAPPGFAGAPGDIGLSDGARARAEAAGPEKGPRPLV